MSRYPILTRDDRAYRRDKIVATYQRGGTIPTTAAMFGMSDSHVRTILKVAGVSRSRGRPRV